MASSDPIDIHLGARLTQRRRELGMSQSTLAERVGISFQQIQKYERGQNRISASRLHHLAAAMDTPIASFFPGAVDSAVTGPTLDLSARRLAEAFMKLEDSRLRSAVTLLVRSLVKGG